MSTVVHNFAIVKINIDLPQIGFFDGCKAAYNGPRVW